MGQSPIIQTQSFSGLGGTSTAVPLSFNSFNSSLGTLNSIQIILQNVTLSGAATGTNNSNVNLPSGDTNGPEDIYVDLTGRLTVSAASVTNIVLRVTDTAGNGQTEIAVGASTPTYTYTDIAVSTVGGNTTSASTNLSSYIGDGTTQITVNVTPSQFGVSGQAFASVDSSANYVSGSYTGGATGSGQVELLYNYTPVPEPSKTAACMIGFALCLLAGRKYFSGHLGVA